MNCVLLIQLLAQLLKIPCCVCSDIWTEFCPALTCTWFREHMPSPGVGCMRGQGHFHLCCAAERVKGQWACCSHFVLAPHIPPSRNIFRGIFSILPYGQQLLFLPDCHLFSCYFFGFIFKQHSTEYGNREYRTDGEQIQITGWQRNPNRVTRVGWGNKISLTDSPKEININ